MAKIKDTAPTEEKAENVIDESALANSSGDDEASLSNALMQNPVKLSFIRNLIHIKNRLVIIPMLAFVAAMTFISFTIPDTVQACNALTSDDYNALLYFINIVLSVLIILGYMRAIDKKASKKMRIIGYVITYVIAAIELFIDIRFMVDIGIERQLVQPVNSISTAGLPFVNLAYKWTLIHAIILGVALVLSVLMPLIQPFAKKIRIKVK